MTEAASAENIVDLKIRTPDRSVVDEASELLRDAKAFAIGTPAHYESAGADLKRIKARMKDLDDRRRELTRPLDESKRRIMAFFDEPLRFLASAESHLKNAMVGFLKKQELARLEAQRQADERARKERERLQERAAQAAAAGKADKATALAERAETVVAPVISKGAPKVAGISTREVWKWRITDAFQVPREYLAIDEHRVGAVVRAMKGDTRIAGIEVYSEQTMAAAGGES